MQSDRIFKFSTSPFSQFSASYWITPILFVCSKCIGPCTLALAVWQPFFGPIQITIIGGCITLLQCSAVTIISPLRAFKSTKDFFIQFPGHAHCKEGKKGIDAYRILGLVVHFHLLLATTNWISIEHYHHHHLAYGAKCTHHHWELWWYKPTTLLHVCAILPFDQPHSLTCSHTHF